MQDVIRFQVLEDGTVSITTDQISGPNHQSADELLENLGDLLGGEITIKRRRGHVHQHRHQENRLGHRH